jgi:hypothetical protein
MENKTNLGASFALCALTVLALSAGALQAEEINREYHETFDVSPGMLLKLKHGDGDVKISPWDRDTLDVLVRYRAKTNTVVGWSKNSELDVTFQQEGDTIYVVGKEPSMVSVGISAYREYEYTYTVQAPSYLQLDLIGDDGDVSIVDWNGELDLRLEDGDIHLTSIESPRTEIFLEDGDLEISGLQGELLVEAEDGDLEIHDCHSQRGRIEVEDGDVDMIGCEGSFEVVAEDGDIRMARLVAEDVEIRTADGSVDLELLPADDLNLTLRSGDGNIDVALDEQISVAFDLENRDGRIRVNSGAVSDLLKEKGRVTGKFGQGAGSLYVSSVDGNITLRQ